MIFIPTESLIFGCFFLAITFQILWYNWCKLRLVTDKAHDYKVATKYVAIFKWSAILFILAALAFGISSSLMPLNEF